MKLIWKYLKRYKKILWGTLVLATINQVFSLLDPQLFRLMIDKYASNPGQYNQQQFLAGIGLLLAAAVGAAFISRVAKNFQDYYVNVITQKLGTQMYADSVQHSFSLSFSVFEDQRSGELLRKLQRARDDAQIWITSAINILFLSLVGIIVVIGYAFYVHWAVGLLYALLIPIVGVITFFISRNIKAAQLKIVKESAALAGSTTETLRNVELVKSLGLESQEIERLNKVNEKILGLELAKVKLIRKLSFTQGTMVNALRASLALLMLWLIFSGDMSIGEYFTLFIYSFFIFSPIQQFGELTAQYQQAQASSQELQAILDIEAEEQPANPRKLSVITSVEFDKVSFVYQSADEASIKDISLKAVAGETIALVGPSGSGKSTIIKLLSSLYKPTDGAVKYNGIDTRDLNVEDLRQRIGLVSQETQLFAGSLKENLLFVRPRASDQECLTALHWAQADDLLNRGDQGLNSKIGEGGMKISGGERQRLAIARALLRQPEVLIFDEATSSLDSITEKAITETIKEIVKAHPDIITILVAHRLSTISQADRIYVLEKGRLVEHGSQAQLLKKRGLYDALWRQQVAS